MKAALYEIFGNKKISERTFAIKGLGKVGFELARLIYKEGGQLIGADINQNTVKTAKKAKVTATKKTPVVKKVKAEENA